MFGTKTKKLHRRLTVIALLQLFITVIRGSLYPLFQYFGLDFFWLMKMHKGNFFFINLQPLYTPVLGVLTISAIISGLLLCPISKTKYLN